MIDNKYKSQVKDLKSQIKKLKIEIKYLNQDLKHHEASFRKQQILAEKLWTAFLD